MTSQQKAQLAQAYRDHETMDQLHEARIKVLRERQELRLQEATARMARQLDELRAAHAADLAQLQRQHAADQSALQGALRTRARRLQRRWALEEAVLRKRLEARHGLVYAPLPPIDGIALPEA